MRIFVQTICGIVIKIHIRILDNKKHIDYIVQNFMIKSRIMRILSKTNVGIIQDRISSNISIIE